MEAALLNEGVVRAGLYLTGLVGLLILEKVFPRRLFLYPRFIRVTSNLSLAFINNVLLQLSFPVLALGAAVLATEKGWGLFQWLPWPSGFELLLGLLLLDFFIYLQHIVFHLVPLFWRLHRVHHADVELDVSTGVRFHPIEIVLSMGLKIGVVLALGVSPLTVFLFELLLMLSSMFNHSNLNIPVAVDRWIRYVIVTPDVHRVHHSVFTEETNSNYGFNFPWWDRLFKTYRAQPKKGHTQMELGLNFFRSRPWLFLHRILIEPFVTENTPEKRK